MQETSLVPYVAEAQSPNETNATTQRKRTPTLVTLMCAVAVLFYGTIAAEYIREHRADGKFFVRLALGEIVGGADNVYALPSGEDVRQYTAYPDESTGDTSLERLGQIEQKSSDGGSILSLINTETPYDVDLDEILEMPRAVAPLDELYRNYGSIAPVVLIIHTHGTEAYAEHAVDGYRTNGKDGVIGIGSVIASVLTENGINAIHCEVPFDQPDFNTAYYSASLAIRDYLSEYPSISYIIDVHRDSILLPDGTYFAPLTTIDGSSAAKLMFVVGTDYAGSGHAGWRDNLALCTRIQSSLMKSYDGLMRGINLRAASFNEQYTKGSMLLEVGSCANTYDEAAASAAVFARALADEIKG